MTPTVHKFIEIVASAHQVGPVVEFGSHQVLGLECDLRPLFPRLPYIGCDLHKGAGVDVLADGLATPFADKSVGTALYCEVLEHCSDPTWAAANALELLSDDGLLVVTTPFLLGIHHMPDYWRFTPQGMDLLLLPATYRAVYFKGDVWLPSAILAIASKSYAPFRKVELALDARLGELPADRPEEHIFRWAGEAEYVRMRSQFTQPMRFEYYWTPPATEVK